MLEVHVEAEEKNERIDLVDLEKPNEDQGQCDNKGRPRRAERMATS
jgi:hypothetical protein